MIKLNSFGPEVEAWQNFLVGQGLFFDHVNGVFDGPTKAATIAFQKLQNLLMDGVVGTDTYNAAEKLGFIDEDIYELSDETNPSWPPRPNDLKPLDDLGRQSLFGKFAFKPAGITNNPEAIIITDTWERDNIIEIYIPQLKNVVGANKGRLSVNRKISNQFLKLFERWEQSDLSHLILSCGGTYAPRFIRGSRSRLSNHAYGSAIDLNVAWNYLGTRGALVGYQGSVRELVPIANELGFYWGGHFGFNAAGKSTGSRPDPMHFEIAKIIDVSDPYV
jgi:hypothetical protein